MGEEKYVTKDYLEKALANTIEKFDKYFKNADDETDEQRLVRRIDQLEKLKENGNALSDAERVELIDDLLQIVRANRRQASSNDNDPNDASNQKQDFENKKTKLGLFL